MKKLYLFLAALFIIAIALVAFYWHQFPAAHTDDYYMELAIQQTQSNPELPFGAVIVDNTTGEILGTGYNRSNENPILHGEIVAINDCAAKHPLVDWKNTTLYTTAEPCPMCQTAIVWAGISRVVFATSSEFLKQNHWDVIDITAREINAKTPFYHGEIKGGVLADKTNALFIASRFVNKNTGKQQDSVAPASELKKAATQ